MSWCLRKEMHTQNLLLPPPPPPPPFWMQCWEAKILNLHIPPNKTTATYTWPRLNVFQLQNIYISISIYLFIYTMVCKCPHMPACWKILALCNTHTVTLPFNQRHTGKAAGKKTLGTKNQFQSLIIDILFLLKHHLNLQADGMVLDFMTSSARKQQVFLEINRSRI